MPYSSFIIEKSKSESVYLQVCLFVSSYHPALMLSTHSQMYKQAMESVHSNLVQKGKKHKLTYTAELLPERQDGQMSVPAISPPILNLLANALPYQDMATIT